jgi:hypothetical protein
VNREQAQADAESSAVQASRNLRDGCPSGYDDAWGLFIAALDNVTALVEARRVQSGDLVTLAGATIGLLRELWLLQHTDPERMQAAKRAAEART